MNASPISLAASRQRRNHALPSVPGASQGADRAPARMTTSTTSAPGANLARPAPPDTSGLAQPASTIRKNATNASAPAAIPAKNSQLAIRAAKVRGDSPDPRPLANAPTPTATATSAAQ